MVRFGRNPGAATSGAFGVIERRLGITVSGVVVVFFAVFGWYLAHLLGGKGLYLLVYGGLAVLVGCVVVARRSRNVEATRSELNKRTREGQVLTVDLTLRAPGRIGLFSIEEEIHPHLGSPVRVSVESLSAGSEWTHRYVLRPRLRGVYRVGPLRAVWGDPLGLATGQQQLLEATEIIVHPATENVFDRVLTRQLQDPPVRPPRTKPWPTGSEFYGMRDYVPGDDLRRVVWKAVARTGRVLVRESEQGITDQVNLVIDTDAEQHSPGDPSDTLETAIRVAASVGARHLKDGFSVTLEENARRLAPTLRGERARLVFLDELARLQRGTVPLHAAIDRLLAMRAANAHNVIITPHFDPKTASRVSLLVGKGASVLIAVIQWDEGDPMSAERATEIGAEVVKVRPGDALSAVMAHAHGAGIR